MGMNRYDRPNDTNMEFIYLQFHRYRQMYATVAPSRKVSSQKKKLASKMRTRMTTRWNWG